MEKVAFIGSTDELQQLKGDIVNWIQEIQATYNNHKLVIAHEDVFTNKKMIIVSYEYQLEEM